jgi:enamine deaminase RidA (YjgF/YER057c/UK114 family)
MRLRICFVICLERTRWLVMGVASLPLGMPVELEVIFEVAE